MKNLFERTSIKLSLTYLAIIMAVSLLFSGWIYRLSVQAVEEAVVHRRPITRELLLRNPNLAQALTEEKLEAVSNAKKRIAENLFFANVGIMLGGGALSYLLARQSLQPIEEAHKAQAQFTSDASHELRTPITAMRSETELALTDKKLTLHKAKKQLQSNIEELDKLTQLSNDLLQMTRAEYTPLQRSIVTMEDLISTVVDGLQATIKKRKQQVVVAAPSSLTATVDEVKIRRVLTILLDNASKFSPSGSTIEIYAIARKNRVEISVSDSGRGIDSVDQVRIFDRFYQADTARQKGAESGYGLGLSIAKSIVEAHNGSIYVKSKLSDGATFTLTLPRR